MEGEYLFYDRATAIPAKKDIGLVILADKDKRRQITFVCQRAMAEEMDRRANMPLQGNADDRMPDILGKLLGKLYPASCRIMILSVRGGKFLAKLVLDDSLPTDTPDNTFDIRLSDAVILSLATGIPMIASKELMKSVSTEYTDSSETVIKLPINTLSDKMLAEALEKAISEENYELASRVRDEMKARQESKEKK